MLTCYTYAHCNLPQMITVVRTIHSHYYELAECPLICYVMCKHGSIALQRDAEMHLNKNLHFQFY
jgi:hypothetical protein